VDEIIIDENLMEVKEKELNENKILKNPNLNDPLVKSQLLQSKPSRLRKEEYSQRKSNSTSTLYVDFTISNPVLSEIVHCLSKALYYNIKQSEEKGTPSGVVSMVFSEEHFPLNDDYNLECSPTAYKIGFFLSLIFLFWNFSNI